MLLRKTKSPDNIAPWHSQKNKERDMILQEGESYDQIFADIERVIMPGVSGTS